MKKSKYVIAMFAVWIVSLFFGYRSLKISGFENMLAFGIPPLIALALGIMIKETKEIQRLEEPYQEGIKAFDKTGLEHKLTDIGDRLTRLENLTEYENKIESKAIQPIGQLQTIKRGRPIKEKI